MKTLQDYFWAKDWYLKAGNVIKAMFGDDSDLFCDLLAAISPQMMIRKNWRIAVGIYTQWKTGVEIDRSELWPCHEKNVDRALNGEKLSGPKVQAFAENLKGNYNRITIDTWVLRYLKSDKLSLTPRQYERIEKRLKDNARKHGLKPAEYQAVIWTKIRHDWGLKPVDFAMVADEIGDGIPF